LRKKKHFNGRKKKKKKKMKKIGPKKSGTIFCRGGLRLAGRRAAPVLGALPPRRHRPPSRLIAPAPHRGAMALRTHAAVRRALVTCCVL